jgi:hypothetical protein
MYERFTDRARKVMQLANMEAQRFNHEYIGTEHILLGLVKEGGGTAATALKNLDVDLRKIRLEVEKIVQGGPDMVTMGKLPQTPRAKKVIEYAVEEARELRHNYVGTEHLLLGLLREQEGVAAQVLMNLGLKLEDVRAEILELLGPVQETAPKTRRRARRPMREYDFYLPLHYNDGSPIEGDKIAGLQRRLREHFGGLTFFPQSNEGSWKYGQVTFHEKIVILRVLAEKGRQTREFFRLLKGELKRELRQEDILIVERRVKVL